MTSKEIKELRGNMSRMNFGVLLASMIGQKQPIQGQTIYRWEIGESIPCAAYSAALVKLKRKLNK